jgi:hypothetical protein
MGKENARRGAIGPHEQGLARAGHAFRQHVAARGFAPQGLEVGAEALKLLLDFVGQVHADDLPRSRKVEYTLFQPNFRPFTRRRHHEPVVSHDPETVNASRAVA